MRKSRSVLAVVATAACLAGTVLAAGPAAATPSTTVVISEVYGGGGNSTAPLTNDFIELQNVGTSDQDLSGWSVQYHSSSATGTWQATALTGTIPAGGHYLVAEGGGSQGDPLPTPDDTGIIAMSSSSGTVALANQTDALLCQLDCPSNAAVIDLVGYGSAAIYEGASAAPGLSNTTSAQRAADGADTDNNGADFTAAAPTPQNSGNTLPPQIQIHDIQGDGFLSPLLHQQVTDVPGIVTGVRSTGSSRGYWLQDPEPDTDPATSEGIFVYTGSAPSVAVGDSVTVSGTVNEYYPDPSTDLSITEIGSATTTTVSSGNALPDPVVLGPGNVPDQYAPDLGGGNIENTPIDPSRSALDLYESLEGMRVEVQDARVVGPSDSYGEQYVTTLPEQAPTYRGGTELLGENQIPSGRLEVVALDGSNPGVNVGDVFQGDTIGPLDYSQFGGYVLEATQLGTVQHNGLPPVVATPGTARQLSIATYNVENLAPTDPSDKYQRLAEGVVDNLRSPDILAVEEVQDNSGATDNGVVAADQTLRNLTQAIRTAGGPRYAWREIDPVNDQDGGQPGGNIRVVFLFNAARVSFVPHGSKNVNRSVTGTRVTNNNGTPGLTLSPGRIDPTNPVWTDSRKPLVGQFRFGGQDVFVVANHFDSKGGGQSADGRFQYPEQSSATQRAGQALVVHNFVRSILDVQPQAQVVVLGDLNDFQFSPALNVLKTGHADGSGPAELTDLITTLPVDQQYTYVYDGVSQVLDHILVTQRIRSYTYQVVHINAEYADQVSDHDPQLVQFRP